MVCEDGPILFSSSEIFLPCSFLSGQMTSMRSLAARFWSVLTWQDHPWFLQSPLDQDNRHEHAVTHTQKKTGIRQRPQRLWPFIYIIHLFENATVHPNYESRCQASWIVQNQASLEIWNCKMATICEQEPCPSIFFIGSISSFSQYNHKLGQNLYTGPELSVGTKKTTVCQRKTPHRAAARAINARQNVPMPCPLWLAEYLFWLIGSTTDVPNKAADEWTRGCLAFAEMIYTSWVQFIFPFWLRRAIKVQSVPQYNAI